MTTARETIERTIARYLRLPEEYDDCADEVLVALESAGWRIAPVEPSEAMVLAITGDAWDAVYEMGRTSERISGGAAHITEADARKLALAVIRAASVVE